MNIASYFLKADDYGFESDCCIIFVKFCNSCLNYVPCSSNNPIKLKLTMTHLANTLFALSKIEMVPRDIQGENSKVEKRRGKSGTTSLNNLSILSMRVQKGTEPCVRKGRHFLLALY